MIKCPVCGFVNDEREIFCKGCGTKLIILLRPFAAPAPRPVPPAFIYVPPWWIN